MEVCTIGASGSSAEDFFSTLRSARVTCVVDTRRFPSSQLAGFSKRDSLRYFLRELLGVDYVYEPLLVPEAELLKAYRSGDLAWGGYADGYLSNLRLTKVSESLEYDAWGVRPVLLCSEPTPDHCHRRLAAEYLMRNLPLVTEVIHLRA